MTSIGDIFIGTRLEKQVSFSLLDMDAFSKISHDRAPIHFDDDFAGKAGFRERIVFGMLAVAPFSQLLGMEIPGPNTVIQALQFNYHNPIYLGEQLLYSATVSRKSLSTRTVEMNLQIDKLTNGGPPILGISGTARCGFMP